MDMQKILVIDDDPGILRMIEFMLDGSGYQCLSFGNAGEGLAMLDHMAVHLILTDIIMPEMEGIELILHARATFPDLPIIAMSGGGRSSRTDVLHLAQQFGAAMVIPKPFTRAELLAAIEKTIGPPAKA
jgi:CheY-like chemotaxis protein